MGGIFRSIVIGAGGDGIALICHRGPKVTYPCHCEVEEEKTGPGRAATERQSGGYIGIAARSRTPPPKHHLLRLHQSTVPKAGIVPTVVPSPVSTRP
jgi:hypothetical protein